MAEVKHFIDQQSIQQDGDLLKGILDDVLTKIEKIKQVKVDLSGLKSFGSAGNAAKELEKTLNDLTKAQEKLATTNAKLSKAAEALAKQQTAESKLRQQQIKETEQLSKQKEKLLKQQEQEVKQLEKNNNAYIELNNQYKQASAASLKRGAELLKEAKGNDQLFLSLLKTDQEYLSNTKAAANYSKQLMVLESSIGRNQRNVGNYASAYNGLARQFGLVANELPSLTISVNQFALALSNNLPLLAEEIKNAKVEIAALKAEGQTAPTLFSKIASGLLSFQVGISILVTALVVLAPKITEFIGGMFGASDAIDAASKKINGFASEADAAGYELAVLNQELDQYITLLTETNSLKSGGDLEVLRAQLQFSWQKEAQGVKTANEAWKQYNNILSEITRLQTSGTINPITGNISVPEISKEELEKLERQASDVLSIYNNANNQVAEELFNQQLLQIRINNQKIKDEEETSRKLKEAYDKRLKILLENARAELEARREARLLTLKEDADLQQSFIDNENLGFDDRLKALENYYLVQEALIESARNFELQDLQTKQRELALSDEQVAEQRLLIQEKYNFAVIRNTREQQEKIKKLTLDNLEEVERIRVELINRNLKRINDAGSIQQSKLEQQRDEELTLLQEQFNNQVISVEEYKREEFRINQKYNRLILEDQLNTIQTLIDAEPDPVKRAQLLAKAANIRKQLSKEVTDEELKNIDKIKQQEEELADLRRRLQNEVLELAKAATLGRFDAEKNQIQESINVLEEKKRKDIEYINATVTNEVEKAARITNAEKRAQVERERLEFRQRQIDIQRAKFEKAFAIAQIALTTIQAVGKIQAQAAILASNPVTAAAAPLALAQVPLTIAIGAAQAAAALATPIPKFKTGKGQYDQYEGPAWVGDGGKSEMIFRENGEIERTPSTPVITWVGKNDIIHPDANALMIKVIRNQSKDAGYTSTYSGFEKVGDTLSVKLDKVAAEIRNKREWHVNWSSDGVNVKTKDRNRVKEYLNKNLQFGK